MSKDFEIYGFGGSVVLFTPNTKAAKAWWADNCEAGQMLGNAHAVEHRYAPAIAEGIADAGLSIA